MKPAKLFNLEVCQGKFSKEIVLRNVPFGIAAAKRKQLISSGVYPRNIWINPINK